MSRRCFTEERRDIARKTRNPSDRRELSEFVVTPLAGRLQPGIVEIFIFLAKRELVEAAPGDAVRRGGGRLVRRGRQGGGGKTDAGARGETKRRIRKRQTERRRGGYARG